MKILLFDNYDSFTYNLLHEIKALGYNDIEVHRNDQISLDEIERFDKIVLSPGPGIPSEAGVLLDLIREYAPKRPILGVCLGHQAIGEAFGAQLENLSDVFHGVQTPVDVVCEELLFEGLERELLVGRYHSWVVSDSSLPAEIEVTARSREGQIMALRHNKYNVRGIQFHPESIMTPSGRVMLENFLKS